MVNCSRFFLTIHSFAREKKKENERKSTASTPEKNVKQTGNDTEWRYDRSALQF